LGIILPIVSICICACGSGSGYLYVLGRTTVLFEACLV
jgi:hypothetical protein